MQSAPAAKPRMTLLAAPRLAPDAERYIPRWNIVNSFLHALVHDITFDGVCTIFDDALHNS
jgi:hypothetical protein